MLARPGSAAARRLLGAGLALLLALCGFTGVAYADADPASDALLVQDSFFPYQPPVSADWQKTVNNLIAAAKAARFPVKVAIIASANDLGGLPDLFGQPQRYADFLDREISFNKPAPLLVVMPQGFGLDALGKPGELNPLLPVHAGQGAEGLARSAVEAIQKLAADAGHPLPAPKLPSASASAPGLGSKGGGGTSPALTFGAPVALVVIAAALVAVTRRRHDEDEEEAGEAGRDA